MFVCVCVCVCVCKRGSKKRMNRCICEWEQVCEQVYASKCGGHLSMRVTEQVSSKCGGHLSMRVTEKGSGQKLGGGEESGREGEGATYFRCRCNGFETRTYSRALAPTQTRVRKLRVGSFEAALLAIEVCLCVRVCVVCPCVCACVWAFDCATCARTRTCAHTLSLPLSLSHSTAQRQGGVCVERVTEADMHKRKMALNIHAVVVMHAPLFYQEVCVCVCVCVRARARACV